MSIFLTNFLKNFSSGQDTGHFKNAKVHQVEFMYSAGNKLGNYKTTCNVFQMGRLTKEEKFTNTVVLTLHDFGLNSFTNYATLFQSEEMKPMLKNFTCFHIDFPCMTSPDLINSAGNNNVDMQSATATAWDRNLIYPSFDELAKAAIPAILDHFSFTQVILISTGAGANVALRFSLNAPEKVMGLIMINPIYGQIGWGEWFSSKLGFTQPTTQENVLSYLFNPYRLSDSSDDLVEATKANLKYMDSGALAGFEKSLLERSYIQIDRPTGIPNQDKTLNTLNVPTCMILGDELVTFRYEDAMELNGFLNPKDSNFCKLADCGCMAHEEQPVKVGECIRLFLQGLGYCK